MEQVRIEIERRMLEPIRAAVRNYLRQFRYRPETREFLVRSALAGLGLAGFGGEAATAEDDLAVRRENEALQQQNGALQQSINALRSVRFGAAIEAMFGAYAGTAIADHLSTIRLALDDKYIYTGVPEAQTSALVRIYKLADQVLPAPDLNGNDLHDAIAIRDRTDAALLYGYAAALGFTAADETGIKNDDTKLGPIQYNLDNITQEKPDTLTDLRMAVAGAYISITGEDPLTSGPAYDPAISY